MPLTESTPGMTAVTDAQSEKNSRHPGIGLLRGLSMPWTHAAMRSNDIWKEKAYLPGMSAMAIGVLGALLASRSRTLAARAIALLGWLGAIGLLSAMIDGALGVAWTGCVPGGGSAKRSISPTCS